MVQLFVSQFSVFSFHFSLEKKEKKKGKEGKEEKRCVKGDQEKEEKDQAHLGRKEETPGTGRDRKGQEGIVSFEGKKGK